MLPIYPVGMKSDRARLTAIVKEEEVSTLNIASTPALVCSRSPPPLTLSHSYTRSHIAHSSLARSTRCRLHLIYLAWLLFLLLLLLFVLQPMQLHLTRTRNLLQDRIERYQREDVFAKGRKHQQQHDSSQLMAAEQSQQQSISLFASSVANSSDQLLFWPLHHNSSFYQLGQHSSERQDQSCRNWHEFHSMSDDFFFGASGSFLVSVDASTITSLATDSTWHATKQPVQRQDSEFDLMSAEYLSRQFIIVYRDDENYAFNPHFSGQHLNTTRSLMKQYTPRLRVIMTLSSLPGSICEINLEGIDDDGATDSVTRAKYLAALLSSIQAHPSVLFITSNRQMSVSGAEMLQIGQAVRQDVAVTPGVRRIFGASRSTVARAATVSVAVLDTGIDLKHPFLNAKQGVNCIQKIERLTRKYRHYRQEANDITSDARNDPVQAISTASDGMESQASEDEDDNGRDSVDLAQDDSSHGTHVAGIIGGLNREGGVAGIAPGTKLFAVKILNAQGQGTFGHLICGLDWVIRNSEKHDIKVVSMSLVGFGHNDDACGERNGDALHKAICQTERAGINIVVAAGNAAQDLARVVPASYPEVLTVTAMADSDGEPGSLGPSLTCRGFEGDDYVASFSNFALTPVHSSSVQQQTQNSSLISKSPWLKAELLSSDMNHSLALISHLVAAPGVCILSTVVGGGFGIFSGTSQATPYVSGLLALEYGSGGRMNGVCNTFNMSSQRCMRQFIQRALDMERIASVYGFRPWPISSERQIGISGTNEVTIDVDVLPITQLQGSADYNRLFQREAGEDEMLAFPIPPLSEARPIMPKQSIASRRMKKYYGPLVVGRIRG